MADVDDNNLDLLALLVLLQDQRQQQLLLLSSLSAQSALNASYEYTKRRFNLDDWSDAWILRQFRFARADILLLVDEFGLEDLQIKKRYKHDAAFGLCLVLRKLSWPCRLSDLSDLFGLHSSSLSSIFNDTVSFLMKRYHNHMEWHPTLLTRDRLYEYAEVLADHGGYERVWGFIDGTFIPFSRPVHEQRHFYSGYKRAHGLKYQVICTPDGMMLAVDGPHAGPLNDMTMVRESGLESRLREILGPRGIGAGNDDLIFLYGDEAYKALEFVICQQPGGRNLPANVRDFNREMSSIRISVENIFGRKSMLWGYNSFKRGLKSGLSPVGAYTSIALLLTNCHTCLHGNQTSERYGMLPPTINAYLRPLAS